MSSRSDGFRDEGSRSESPEVDYSVIRTAIKIGGKVIEQVMNGIHYGSSEVRNLLLEECDLILECKVCSNLFRSLPNFVAHKRVYCTDSYEDHKRKETDFASAKTEDTIVVQPVSPSATAVEMSASVPDNANPNQSVIEKVVNRTFEGQSKSYSFFTKVAEKVEARKITIPTSTLTLKSIPSNQNAKVMTIDDTGQSGNAASNIQITDAEDVNNRRGAEVRYRSNVADTAGNVVSKINRSKPSIGQLCEKLASRSAVVLNSVQDQAKTSKISARSIRSRKSSPRKSIDSFITMKDQNDERIQIKNSSPSPSQKSTVIVENDSRVDTDFSVDMREFVVDNALDRTWLTHCDIKTLTCKTCDKSFTTPYGLKFHCKMKHVDKMIQYPCPQCTKSFTYFTALARHLRKVHTKSETYIEYVQAKLKGKLGRRKSMEDIGTDSNEGSPESLKKNMLALDTGWRKCDKCGKIFWKAKSYNRHYQYCKGKAEGSKSIESSPTKLTGQKDKEHVKKDSEELISISDKVENMKDKPTFNENLTIRTRKQAECLSQTVEKAQKSSAITIRISEPAETVQEKAGVICTKHEKMPSNKEYAKHIQKGKTETDMEKKEQSPLHTQAGKKISSKLFNEKAGQVNFLRKIQTPPEKMVMKKHVLQNESADAHNEQHIIEVHADRNIFAKLTSERVKQGNLPSNEKNKMSPGKNYATRKIVLENKNAFARKEQSSEAIQTDKDFRSKSVAEAADQGHLSSAFNLNSTGNKKRSPDRTMITRKQVSEKRSVQTVIEKDNVHVNESSQNASLNKSSILEKEVRNQSELRKSKDKHETSGISVPPATKCLPETSEASSEGYIKPVTRGSDGTLSLKKMKTSSDDKPNSGIEAVKSPGYSKNDWKPIGKQSTNELDKKLTPAMQQDTVVMKGDNAVDLSIAVKENVCSVEDKSGNEKAKDVSSNQKGLLLTIPDLPQVKKADSTRGTLDSPTWSDNPMLKFKMTVQEMAELVESASLTKFARERKKKAKQILYKKQNGANQLAKMKNIARGVSSKAKLKKKIQVPPVKKVYGTRQSSGSKVETVTSLEKESEQGSRRYSTRNMNVKLTGDKDLSDIVEQSNKEVHKLEAPSNKNMPLSKKLNTEIAISAVSAQPFKDLEQATLNSKRKEFLAAKRDQRRKFLLANKTASPKKVSPVKSIKSKSLKESLDTISQEIKTVHKDSRSPGSNEKRNNKAPEQIRSKLIEKFETHRTHLRSHDQDHFAANQQQLKTKESEISNKVSVDPVLTRGRPSRHSASPVQKKGYSHRSKSASSERTGRTVRQKSVSLERRRTSLPESSIFQRSRRMVRHKLLESDRYGISRRSKSSESSPSSKMHITHTAFEKENLSQSNRELRKPNTRSETTQNSSQSDNQDKNLKDDDSNIMVECVVLIQKKTVENIESPVAETKMKETDTHPHKTRLSTGSLTLNSRTSKSETESILSAAEDSSEALVSESKITLKKKRKRHFSAPQEIVKPEPKRYSLLTGVIQCERCGKAFWKKKRHTEHLKKSSCAKQNSGKSHVSNTGLKDIVQEKEMPQSCQINPMEVPKLLDTSIRNDQILDVSSNREKNVSKSAVKRPLSTSPKPLNESCHLDNKNSVKYAESKRPRLEPNESTTRSSFHSSDIENTMDMQLPEKKERNNESKNLAFRKVSEVSSHGQERLSGESPISSELPGTSKDFFDEDSDTGSEFSGFSEADLSYPILPDDISDFESDCSLKNDAEKDSDESSCSRYSDDLGKGSNILFDKVPAHKKDNNVISVEEIWVEKEPGMPVIEKTKSNRIYVMDTDSSRKLHCQDKRNIDSFVDEDNLKCLRCEREYTSISNLRQHVIRHLGWKRYQCKMCSIFSCYNMSEVRMHLLRSHDVHIENELGLQKYVKDLNKEAGKKRSSKRMKTIKKKKEIESPVELRTKRSAKKKERDSAGSTITNKITADKTTSDSISQLISSQSQEEITSNTSIVDENKQKKVSENQEHTILRSHDQSKTPAIEKNTASLNESAGHTVRETNGVVQVEAVNESNGPLKKSVRLAAKEDSRKSAVEILKGPKLPFSPKRPVAASKTDVKKPGSPQKVKKPTTKTTESDNKGDESLLSRARQMLATVLK